MIPTLSAGNTGVRFASCARWAPRSSAARPAMPCTSADTALEMGMTLRDFHLKARSTARAQLSQNNFAPSSKAHQTRLQAHYIIYCPPRPWARLTRECLGRQPSHGGDHFAPRSSAGHRQRLPDGRQSRTRPSPRRSTPRASPVITRAIARVTSRITRQCPGWMHTGRIDRLHGHATCSPFRAAACLNLPSQTGRS